MTAKFTVHDDWGEPLHDANRRAAIVGAGKPLTITPNDYHLFRAAHRDQWEKLQDWIRDIGIDADRTVTVTLGEGFVSAEVMAEPVTANANGDLVTFTVTYPAPTPPPCWPARFAS